MQDRFCSVEETGLFIHLLLKRSGKKRIRLSSKSFRQLAGRRKITSYFVQEVRNFLNEIGLVFEQLGSGHGTYGVMYRKSLEAAPTLSPEPIKEDLERYKMGALTLEWLYDEVEDACELELEER